MTQGWRTALVTGASSGIGREFAAQLGHRGVNLVVVARRAQRLEELGAELREAHGIDVEVLPADLTQQAGLAAVEDRLRDAARPVDVLVNNAGFGTHGPFQELDPEREDAEIRLNVVAVTRLTHAAVGGMSQRGRGAVVNVSSMTSFQPVPYSATYAATKAFVTSFSQSLHEELRGSGVRMLALCPGFVRTEFHEVAGVDRDIVPSGAWLRAPDVVSAALGALARGDALCVPGIGYKLLAASTHLAPRSAVRRIAGMVTRMGLVT
ncbi:MAG: SDR family NAD(P)-dependent oxidoreductase [Nitriliruptorales bacterium]